MKIFELRYFFIVTCYKSLLSKKFANNLNFNFTNCKSNIIKMQYKTNTFHSITQYIYEYNVMCTRMHIPYMYIHVCWRLFQPQTPRWESISANNDADAP